MKLFSLTDKEENELSKNKDSNSVKDLPASVERYFQSLEFSNDVSVAFEPVPEPDIDATPRDGGSRFVVQGIKNFFSSSF